MADKIVVIRVSLIDGIDPLEEIDKLIKSKGCCWFGKYGRALAESRLETRKDDENLFAILLYKNKDGNDSGYTTRTYKVEAHQRRLPKKGPYPRYYKSKLMRIGQWFKFRRAKQLPLSKVYGKSSFSPITRSLHYSMAPFFYCYLAG